MTRQKNGIWKLTDADMNYLSMLAYEASERYTAIGMNALAKGAEKQAQEIFSILGKAGYYDDVRISRLTSL